ncbi:ABC transporter permease [Ramlibacter sp. G-1-2-2]|uniref:ABC transporter permease n=1 Tax=Ramlibacter agri TaxID=2728837 RepID=A0A848HC66_9BURK|nr:ABC transporter permease [Ramlibacter agri]NML46991.1 ABC transporter permease [Ramlibacter agri]
MNRLGSFVLLVLLLVGWEAGCRVFDVPQLVLPAPSVVAASLWKGLASGYFWPHIRATALELVLGTLAGCALGFLTGVLMAEAAGLRRLLMPYVVVSQVVPKLALAPLFVLWFGFGTSSRVVITALICFFPLLENTLTALQQVGPERLELFRLLGASRLQTLLRLKLPSGLPGILAGVRVAVVLALVGAVVGEFVSANQGLGALVIASQGNLDTPLMFAVLLLIAALGMLAYQATLLLERWLLLPFTRTS